MATPSTRNGLCVDTGTRASPASSLRTKWSPRAAATSRTRRWCPALMPWPGCGPLASRETRPRNRRTGLSSSRGPTAARRSRWRKLCGGLRPFARLAPTWCSLTPCRAKTSAARCAPLPQDTTNPCSPTCSRAARPPSSVSKPRRRSDTNSASTRSLSSASASPPCKRHWKGFEMEKCQRTTTRSPPSRRSWDSPSTSSSSQTSRPSALIS
mmetsp:Transcript_2959/g.7823  ORF Transcript_2959/g.7823 Transcript_2959/m.7823 type:complete len:211 (-) Transcript_2959:1434-2066(-)